MTSFIESARILSGILASDKISEDVKKPAEVALIKAIQGMEKAMEVEKQMITRVSADAQGIIS